MRGEGDNNHSWRVGGPYRCFVVLGVVEDAEALKCIVLFHERNRARAHRGDGRGGSGGGSGNGIITKTGKASTRTSTRERNRDSHSAWIGISETVAVNVTAHYCGSQRRSSE